MKKLLFAAAAVWLLAACNKELGPEYETPLSRPEKGLQ